MTEILATVWSVLNIAVTTAKIKDSNIGLNYAAKSKFDRLFEERYDYFQAKSMNYSIQYPSRHIFASIIIAAAIEADVVVYQGEIPEGQVFIGHYLIPICVGLSFMLNQLNKILAEKGQIQIEQLYTPAVFSCNTSYLQIYASKLYYTNELTNWKLSLLDMADNLFLLEALNLEKYGIDPCIIKT